MKATRLVADVGGTNTRLALYDENRAEFRALSRYTNADYSSLESVLAHWMDTLAETAPSRACIAAAAPPDSDRVSMTNIGWSFSRSELAARFGLREVAWLNDFQANAWSLPFLGEDDLALVHDASARPRQTLATVGPGTGLGGGTLQWLGDTAFATACEPGHAGLSPETALELEIFRTLLPREGGVYAEWLVSGIGLTRLCAAIAEIHAAPCPELTPQAISARAIAGEDELCGLALGTFCALLGSACGDFVLSTGAYGGLYIAGGIVPQMVPFLRESDFLARFQNKGTMAEHLTRVPVHIITAEHPGLLGAAHAPLTLAC